MDELRQHLQDRLTVLLQEADIGEQRLRVLEQEETALRETLLRIAGAVQVLREVLAENAENPEPVPSSPSTT